MPLGRSELPLYSKDHLTFTFLPSASAVAHSFSIVRYTPRLKFEFCAKRLNSSTGGLNRLPTMCPPSSVVSRSLPPAPRCAPGLRVPVPS